MTRLLLKAVVSRGTALLVAGHARDTGLTNQRRPLHGSQRRLDKRLELKNVNRPSSHRNAATDPGRRSNQPASSAGVMQRLDPPTGDGG